MSSVNAFSSRHGDVLPPRLFDVEPPSRGYDVPADALSLAAAAGPLGPGHELLRPEIDERVLDVYNRAVDPDDPFELRDLWIGRVENELRGGPSRPDAAQRWRASRPRRDTHPDEVLSSGATVRFVKELFNFYFRDDLYGQLRRDDTVYLSSGSVDEQAWGLPRVLKECLRFAIDHDLYGYSDSRGRGPAREAVAAYENARMDGGGYTGENVVLTMGGTFGVSSLADFLLHGPRTSDAPVLCAIPNYPPLVQTIARRHPVRLVPLASQGGVTRLGPLLDALTEGTPMIMLQTVGNPTGALVDEADLDLLIQRAGPGCTVVLDECHEWLGPLPPVAPHRTAANVVRVSSLSKTWSAPGLKIGWMLADERFVAEYYEYASTTFGGPPSFFYTLVEVLARLERWFLTGLVSVGAAELAEFEPGYGLNAATLQSAYADYRSERARRDTGLMLLRDATTVGLHRAGGVVIPPRYSINTAVRLPDRVDSYLAFRELHAATGVAVFPAILTFHLADAVVRVTSAQRWDNLAEAFERIGRLAVSVPS